MIADYELMDDPCPHCGHFETRYRDCDNIGCEDGWCDDFEEDPLWFSPGDSSPCPECRGTGQFQWCPQCGLDPRKTGQKQGEVTT